MYVHDRIDPNDRFRERRRQARRRRRVRRAVLIGVVAAAAAGAGLGFAFAGSGTGGPHALSYPDLAGGKLKPPAMTPLPEEIRGVHVTMALASLPGKIDEYFALQSWGLNTIELDVKDENGEVGFVSSHAPLAKEIGSARPYYDPHRIAAKARARGIYLIGRVVTFEDPVLTARRPDLALRTTDGSVWKNNAGLGWANQYDRRVWKYNVDIAVAAARAGFDEIQFDYVRFPSDGDLSLIVYPGARREPKARTIASFLAYARSRLRPLGVRVSADVFGLSATHSLGIGQVPRVLAKHLDSIYPMVYPSHYYAGEYNLDDPNSAPGQTVAYSLRDFRRKLRGTQTKIVPWLQDFSLGRTYTLTDVQEQIASARRMGSRGFLLWNPSGVYTKEALAAG